MSRVLITGSADGLGLMAAQRLVAEGHEVVLHARDRRRAQDARAGVPEADDVLVGDLSSIAQTRKVAEQANASGEFDAVTHNAGIGYREPRRIETEDGLEHVFAINVLAPYLLTALIARPRRLVYLSSGLHRSGTPSLDDLQWERRPWNGSQAYSDSKLFDVVLAFTVARRWPGVLSNALEPGWVATKMGGRALPTTWPREPRPRSGWPPATIPRPRSAAATSTTAGLDDPTPRPPTPGSRTACWRFVGASPARGSPTNPPAERARMSGPPRRGVSGGPRR